MTLNKLVAAEEKFRKLQALTLKAYHELNLAKSGFESTKLLITAYAQLGNRYIVHGYFVRFVSPDVQ